VFAVSTVTTHVLDTALGRPAARMLVRLEHLAESGSTEIGRAETDADGRVADLGPARIEPGVYRLIFHTAAYSLAQAGDNPEAVFFPEVTVTFTVTDQNHYHVPLLLSPFGYATYRGS